MQRLKTTLPYLVLALCFVLLVATSSYSFNWVDESFYLSLADRLYRGCAPFVDEWHPSQIYAPLLLPFYAGYVKVMGGTDGIIYFFRLLYTLIAFVTSLVAYRVLSKDFGRGAALAIALSYLFYIRANILGMSYYSLCTTFFLLGLLTAWLAWKACRRDDGSAYASRVLLPLLSGLFLALSICCNPYVVVPYALTCLGCLIAAAIKHDSRIALPVVWSMCGAILAGALYLMFLFGRVSPGDLIANLGNVLASHDENLTFAQRIPNYLSYLPVSKVGFAGTAALTIFLIAWRAMKRPMGNAFKVIILAIDLVLLALTCYVALTSSLHPNKAFLAFVEFAIPVYLLSHDLSPKAHPELFLFWLPGVALSLVWQFSSNTQICGILIGCSIAFMGAAITVAGEIQDAEGTAAGVETWLRRIAVILLVCLTVFIRLESVYSDADRSELDTTIADGPAAGLVTTQQHAQEYGGVLELVSYIDDDQGVWICPMEPWAYLETRGTCAAVSTWNTFMDADDAQIYYEELEHAEPGWILLANDDLGEAVNVVAGKEHAFPSLEMYYDYNAQLRETLDASNDYAPIKQTEYGTLYKRASKASYINQES